tara:strand:- start:604 stop:900 length:297 start_codon:yes stop_codon:yes gene_type:complete
MACNYFHFIAFNACSYVTICYYLNIETQPTRNNIMTLSKSDTKDLNTMLQHAAAGNIETFDRLITSWIRSAPSGLVLAKRTAAISAVMGRIKSNQANA